MRGVEPCHPQRLDAPIGKRKTMTEIRVTHYGHACVLIELWTSGGTSRVLIDPGTYSQDFETLRDLDLILITHDHPDHLDSERLRTIVTHNPQVKVVHGRQAAPALEGLPTVAASPGDELTVNGVAIAVTGNGKHACMHPDLPDSENNGYLVERTVLHPGDALAVPPAPVDVLLLPAGGPWMKLQEGIDYLRAVAPRVAIPVHQAGLAAAHQELHHNLLRKLAPENTEVVVLNQAVPRVVT
jgi:L-ascorbate metabolism protein UlaG (beta-lactamase superfamily)